jgi:hypothetical protein
LLLLLLWLLELVLLMVLFLCLVLHYSCHLTKYQPGRPTLTRFHKTSWV